MIFAILELSKAAISRAAYLLRDLEYSLSDESEKMKALCSNARSVVINPSAKRFGTLEEDDKDSIRFALEVYKSFNSDGNKLASSLAFLEQETNSKKHVNSVPKRANSLEIFANFDNEPCIEKGDHEMDDAIEEWIAGSREHRKNRKRSGADMHNVLPISESLVEPPHIAIENSNDSLEIENELFRMQNRLKERLAKNLSFQTEQLLFAESKSRASYVVKESTKKSKQSALAIQSKINDLSLEKRTTKQEAPPLSEKKKDLIEDPLFDQPNLIQFSYTSKPNPISNAKSAGSSRSTFESNSASKYSAAANRLRERFNKILAVGTLENSENENPEDLIDMKESFDSGFRTVNEVKPDDPVSETISELPVKFAAIAAVLPSKTLISKHHLSKFAQPARKSRLDQSHNSSLISKDPKIEVLTPSMLFKKPITDRK